MDSSHGKKEPPPLPGRPRRRQEQRHPHVAPLEVKCSSWANFRQLFSLNIASSGLFVPSDQEAKVGETVRLKLRAPDSTAIRLLGVVRHVLAESADRPAGLGVQLTEVVEPDRSAYQRLIHQAAGRNRPTPASGTPTAPPGTAPHHGHDEESDSIQIDEDFAENLRRTAQARGGGAAGSGQPPANRPDSRPAPPPIGRPGTSPGYRSPHATKPASQTGSVPAITPVGLSSKSARDRHEPIVAVDFGTSRSSIAIVIGNNINLIRLPEGGWDLPSVVGFLDDGSAVVGNSARRLLESNPMRVVASPKRLLGRQFDDQEIQPFLASLAIPYSRGPYGDVLLHVDNTTYTMGQICAPILYRLKAAAEAWLGHTISDIVATTPVGFDQPRYTALEQTARLAGLNIVEFVDEPTAAALTHRFDSDFHDLVAVYDFGGGTFDFSVVDANAADVHVVATAGDTWLGGDDFDAVIAGAAANDFWRQHDVELRNQVVQWQRLLLASERSKRELSSREATRVHLANAALRSAGELSLDFPITRQRFAELSSGIIQRTFETCAQALDLADLPISRLSGVYLSGGSSYIPAVRQAVARYFGKVPRTAVPPERAVVTGAAMYAALLRAASIHK